MDEMREHAISFVIWFVLTGVLCAIAVVAYQANNPGFVGAIFAAGFCARYAVDEWQILKGEGDRG